MTRTPAVRRATVAPYYVKRQPDSRKYNFRRLILQLLPNLQTTFVSKWVHDVSRHRQLVSSHQITSETALLIIHLNLAFVVGDDIGVSISVRFAELELNSGILILLVGNHLRTTSYVNRLLNHHL